MSSARPPLTRPLPPGVTLAGPDVPDILADVAAQMVNKLAQKGVSAPVALEYVVDAIADQLAVGGIYMVIDGAPPVRLVIIDGELCCCADAVAEA